MFQTFLKYLEILTGLFKFKSETLKVDQKLHVGAGPVAYQRRVENNPTILFKEL